MNSDPGSLPGISTKKVYIKGKNMKEGISIGEIIQAKAEGKLKSKEALISVEARVILAQKIDEELQKPEHNLHRAKWTQSRAWGKRMTLSIFDAETEKETKGERLDIEITDPEEKINRHIRQSVVLAMLHKNNLSQDFEQIVEFAQRETKKEREVGKIESEQAEVAALKSLKDKMRGFTFEIVSRGVEFDDENITNFPLSLAKFPKDARLHTVARRKREEGPFWSKSALVAEAVKNEITATDEFKRLQHEIGPVYFRTPLSGKKSAEEESMLAFGFEVKTHRWEIIKGRAALIKKHEALIAPILAHANQANTKFNKLLRTPDGIILQPVEDKVQPDILGLLECKCFTSPETARLVEFLETRTGEELKSPFWGAWFDAGEINESARQLGFPEEVYLDEGYMLDIYLNQEANYLHTIGEHREVFEEPLIVLRMPANLKNEWAESLVKECERRGLRNVLVQRLNLFSADEIGTLITEKAADFYLEKAKAFAERQSKPSDERAKMLSYNALIFTQNRETIKDATGTLLKVLVRLGESPLSYADHLEKNGHLSQAEYFRQSCNEIKVSED